jgi:hypothetical protein
MGIGCFLTIVATFMQTFAPAHNLGVFIGGRVIIGLGQGIALSMYFLDPSLHDSGVAHKSYSIWSDLHRRIGPTSNSR